MRIQRKIVPKLFIFFKLKRQVSVFTMKILMNKLPASNELHRPRQTAITTFDK